MAEDRIKWQSKLFPRLILTEEHYQVMRERYRHIQSFKDELEKLEAWLYANEQKRPRKNWKNQINNWMRKADEIARDKLERKSRTGALRPVTHREASESLKDIFQKIAVEAPTNENDQTQSKT